MAAFDQALDNVHNNFGAEALHRGGGGGGYMIGCHGIRVSTHTQPENCVPYNSRECIYRGLTEETHNRFTHSKQKQHAHTASQPAEDIVQQAAIIAQASVLLHKQDNTTTPARSRTLR